MLAGSDRRTYTGHEIGECARLTLKDFDSIKNNIALNYAALEETEELSPELQYQLQPGWDDEELASVEENPSSAPDE